MAYWQINTFVLPLRSSFGSTIDALFPSIRHLGVVAILPAETFQQHVALIDYNLVYFREGVQEGCELLAGTIDPERD